MNEQIKTEYEKLIKLIQAAGELADRPADLNEFYNIAQKILSQRAYMTGLVTRAEQAYEARKLELRTEKDASVAASENEAKTEEVYARYKNIKGAVDTADEQVKLLKKMLTARDSEYSMS